MNSLTKTTLASILIMGLLSGCGGTSSINSERIALNEAGKVEINKEEMLKKMLRDRGVEYQSSLYSKNKTEIVLIGRKGNETILYKFDAKSLKLVDEFRFKNRIDGYVRLKGSQDNLYTIYAFRDKRISEYKFDAISGELVKEREYSSEDLIKKIIKNDDKYNKVIKIIYSPNKKYAAVFYSSAPVEKIDIFDISNPKNPKRKNHLYSSSHISKLSNIKMFKNGIITFDETNYDSYPQKIIHFKYNYITGTVINDSNNNSNQNSEKLLNKLSDKDALWVLNSLNKDLSSKSAYIDNLISFQKLNNNNIYLIGYTVRAGRVGDGHYYLRVVKQDRWNHFKIIHTLHDVNLDGNGPSNIAYDIKINKKLHVLSYRYNYNSWIDKDYYKLKDKYTKKTVFFFNNNNYRHKVYKVKKIRKEDVVFSTDVLANSSHLEFQFLKYLTNRYSKSVVISQIKEIRDVASDIYLIKYSIETGGDGHQYYALFKQTGETNFQELHTLEHKNLDGGPSSGDAYDIKIDKQNNTVTYRLTYNSFDPDYHKMNKKYVKLITYNFATKKTHIRVVKK
jgi:hypothetical protein